MEILCKTNPKTINFEMSGRTGEAELTSTELASMLHGLSDGAYLVGMCVHGQYTQEKVANHVYDLIKSGEIKIKEKRSHEIDKPILTMMALLAVKEVISGNKCPACNGTKLDSTMIKDCCTCSGTGILNPTQSWRARYCRADDWSYWRAEYDKLYGKINEWLHDSMNKIYSEQSSD
jgi:hypothetical protein